MFFDRVREAKICARIRGRIFGRFCKAERGNVLPLFALSIIPVFGLVGAAIDYSRAATMRSEIQAALDSTALMLSKEAVGLTETQLQEKATAYFQAVFQNSEANNVVLTPTLTRPDSGTFQLLISASAKINTTFTRIIGQDALDVGSNTEVSWGIKRLELAMALDNTGSMSSKNKLTELKKAAKNLLDTLYKAAKKKDDIKVAVIPFSTDVNIGASYANAAWLDWSNWEANNGTCANYKSKNAPTTQASCLSDGGTWTASNRSKWKGCVWDRAQPHDVDDTAPTSIPTQFQPHETSYCPPGTLLPLTDVFTNWVSSDLTASSPTSVLGKKIDSMVANGNTNVTIGAVWGWHALTSSEPLTQAEAPAPDLDKVLILLTDGDNTQNRFSSTQKTIDDRTQKVCENIKSANIKVYTVRVIDGNATLLSNCASRPEMYYDVQSASQLNAVFTDIAQNLASLRISR